MVWPGWSHTLPLLATVLTMLAAVLATVWTAGRIFRPWMREAARAAADDVRADVKALGDKLAENDFPHVEARMDKGLKAAEERVGRVEAWTGTELAAMEGRIKERLEQIETALNEATPDRCGPRPEGGGNRGLVAPCPGAHAMAGMFGHGCPAGAELLPHV